MKSFFLHLSKQQKIIFILTFIFCSFIFTNLASAQETPSVFSFGLNIEIPGSQSTYTVGSNMLGIYIKAWYQFLLGVIGIIATVMIMIGGFKYLSSQGDKGKIQEAQSIIISAITGLLLAFGSVAILNLVNPELLKLRMPTVPGIAYSGTYDKVDRPVRLGGNTAETNGTPREPGDVPDELKPAVNGETLEDFIAREEGAPALTPKQDICCTYATGCPGGGCQWYLGYGHACGNTAIGSTVPPAGCDSSITPEQADAWLTADIATAQNIAIEAVGESTWNTLSDGRQGALTDMAYVMGSSTLNNFTNTLGAVRSGDWPTASYQMRDSEWGRSQASNRAARNAWIMNHGSRP
jgi:GH24 family phage-related lysozyme (muramidase)